MTVRREDLRDICIEIQNVLRGFDVLDQFSVSVLATDFNNSIIIRATDVSHWHDFVRGLYGTAEETIDTLRSTAALS